jgi:hypothetical protein
LVGVLGGLDSTSSKLGFAKEIDFFRSIGNIGIELGNSIERVTMNSRFASFLLSLYAATPLSAQLTVSNTDDSGEGSLRQAITDCPADGTITFDLSLSGEIITLGGSQLDIDKSLTIDASGLSDGIIIDGGGNGDFVQDGGESRCFFVFDGDPDDAIMVTLNNLTIQNGSYKG